MSTYLLIVALNHLVCIGPLSPPMATMPVTDTTKATHQMTTIIIQLPPSPPPFTLAYKKEDWAKDSTWLYFYDPPLSVNLQQSTVLQGSTIILFGQRYFYLWRSVLQAASFQLFRNKKLSNAEKITRFHSCQLATGHWSWYCIINISAAAINKAAQIVAVYTWGYIRLPCQ